MAKLYVSFLWHYHQPYYEDPVTGHFALPWVRLHAIKDYIGMANLIAEFPQIRPVINFVPSLVKQINEYLCGRTDTAMMLARMPADSLSHQQAVEMLHTFFAANRESMIHPHPRYRQLLARCELSRRSAEQVAREFSAEDFRDLQVWGNLAHFHPTIIENDSGLRHLVHKGRAFTEDERDFVLDRQLAIMAEIVPLHRTLAASGQIELTTSPFYHTVVPLLCDHTTARAANPDLDLPQPMLCAPEDAAAQTDQAIAYHTDTFGSPPRGMWPPEGAVSDDAAALFAAAGINWIATDEEVLAQTLGTRFSRGRAGVVDQPEKLYRPYRLRCDGHKLNVVFRDHALSDLIGFRYHLRDPRTAAKDLIGRLESIRRAAPDNALVTIALDGENCWEYYPDQGVEFLRRLYGLLSDTPEIETIRISDYLDEFGAAQDLDHIFPGSWVRHGFAPWMGHWEKNRAWEHLTRARDFHSAKAAEQEATPAKLAAARDEIYVAEGSDWFWWYGDDHSTGSDSQFDSLFRKRVRRVYELLDARPPDELLRPIINKPAPESWRSPRGLINVRVDGRRTSFFEWLGAGTYEQAQDVGAMQRAEPAPVTGIQFGFSADSFFLGLDLAEVEGASETELAIELWIGEAERPALVAKSGPDDATVAEANGVQVQAARDRILEIGAPLHLLGLAPGQAVELFVRIFEAHRVVQRIPASGAIPLTVPDDPTTVYSGAEDLV